MTKTEETSVQTLERPQGAISPSLTGSFLSIDVLRGIAATAVVLLHANGLFWRKETILTDNNLVNGLGIFVNHMLKYGFYGVNLFFVLSGFCIHLPQAKEQPLSWRSFALRRFLRLYPVYLVVMIAIFLLLGLTDGIWREDVTISNFLFHLVFWFGFNSDPSGISPVFWTLALEVQFYFMYAMCLASIRRWGGPKVTLFFMLLSVVYRCFLALSSLSPNELHWFFSPRMFPVARFGEWLLGVVIAEKVVSLSKPNADRTALISWCVPIGTFLLLIGVALKENQLQSWLLTDVLMSLGLACFVLWFVCRELRQGISKGVIVRTLSWLGDRSYTLYLVHFTILASVFEIYCRAKGITHKDALGGTPESLIPITFGLLLSLGITQGIYRYFEKPMHEFARSRSRKMREVESRGRLAP